MSDFILIHYLHINLNQVIELFHASIETLLMVLISGILSGFLGLVLGVLLYLLHPKGMISKVYLYKLLSAGVNICRSFPFLILMIALIPFTRMIVGTSIGTTAAIIPLTVAAIPFYARIVESALLSVPESIAQMGISMGGTVPQVIMKICLPESAVALAQGMTLTLVTLVGYSAMAGTVGGGGLGDLAIRYGYQRFEIPVMIFTILILIILVQFIQMLGDKISSLMLH